MGHILEFSSPGGWLRSGESGENRRRGSVLLLRRKVGGQRQTTSASQIRTHQGPPPGGPSLANHAAGRKVWACGALFNRDRARESQAGHTQLHKEPSHSPSQMSFEQPETIHSMVERLRPMPRLIDAFTLKACIDSLLRRITEVEACAAKLASESTEQP